MSPTVGTLTAAPVSWVTTTNTFRSIPAFSAVRVTCGPALGRPTELLTPAMTVISLVVIHNTHRYRRRITVWTFTSPTVRSSRPAVWISHRYRCRPTKDPHHRPHPLNLKQRWKHLPAAAAVAAWPTARIYQVYRVGPNQKINTEKKAKVVVCCLGGT